MDASDVSMVSSMANSGISSNSTAQAAAESDVIIAEAEKLAKEKADKESAGAVPGEGGEGGGRSDGRGGAGAAIDSIFGGVRSRVSSVLNQVHTGVENAKDVTKTYIEGTSHMVKDVTQSYIDAGKKVGTAVVEKSSQVGHSAVTMASDVTTSTYQTVKGARDSVMHTTSATVNKVGEVASSGINKVGDMASSSINRVNEVTTSTINLATGTVSSARQRVKGFLAHGWNAKGDPDGESAEDASSPRSLYKNLLQFERAAEITVAAGARERLPFVLKKGYTVMWEFRVKDFDVGFEFSERIQDYGGAVEKPLIQIQKVKSGSAVKGSYRSEEEKNVVLVWDNSNSYLRSKNVAFVVRVLRPEGSSPSPTNEEEEVIEKPTITEIPVKKEEEKKEGLPPSPPTTTATKEKEASATPTGSEERKTVEAVVAPTTDDSES